jgi:hypothetical protein
MVIDKHIERIKERWVQQREYFTQYVPNGARYEEDAIKTVRPIIKNTKGREFNPNEMFANRPALVEQIQKFEKHHDAYDLSMS